MPSLLLAATIVALSVLGGLLNPATAEAADRVPFTTGRVVGSPEPPPPYRLARVLPRQTFKDPLYLANEPDTDRLLVVEYHGKVWAVDKSDDTARRDLFLEVPHDLYGLAFHPNYATNGYVFAFGNTTNAKPPRNRVVRYKVSGDEPRRCDPKSERVILEWESNGHDGGDLAFGPKDGHLYISAGDSTTSSDPKETGQDLSDLLSAMIRIDVDHPEPGRAYSVPKDNPFVGLPGARP